MLESWILILTSAGIGFVHTLLGPDHYLPFVVISKARRWSNKKTSMVTLMCGVGHVLSSVILGFVGIAMGFTLFRLERFESFREEVACWFLLVFGFTYFVWGIHRLLLKKPHNHSHLHEESRRHGHLHSHLSGHSHVHGGEDRAKLTPWILFTIFIFGPCEPLIPILMYPAARGNMLQAAIVAGVFSVATIATMLALVTGLSYGLGKLFFCRMEKYSHAVAGFIIFLCGAAIKLFGL